jgi:hypothetical protein
MVCPHCQQPILDHSGPLAHFTSATQAAARGLTLCDRAGKRIARNDWWGWACAAGHTCHLGRLPAVPGTSD